MTLSLSTFLLSLFLCTTVQAAPTAETEAVFQNAMHIAEANQQRLDLLIAQEQQGHTDKQMLMQAMQDITQSIQTYEVELRKASTGGHAVASYLLGNLQASRATLFTQDAATQRARACALYQTATDQGLLAGSVVLMRDCETASQRFKFDDPELLRLQSQLLKALQQPDPYTDHYPLPVMNSLCFKTLKLAAVDGERPLSSLVDVYTPARLSLEQFRADGYYLLAIKGDVDSSTVRDYFTHVQALAPDCLNPFGLR